MSESTKPQSLAGREQAVLRIRNHLNDPVNTPSPAFIGRAGVGKTTLLHHFAGMPTDSIVGVYVALRRYAPSTHDAWIHALIDALFQTLDALDFTISSIERPNANDADTLKTWLFDDLLPAVQRVIHKHRRLVWLMDDADVLAETGLLPACVEDLRALRQAHGGVVLSFDITFDDRLALFAPLIDAADAYRLRNLDPPAIQSALQSANIHAEGASLNAIFRVTGGDPTLLSAFTAHLPHGEVLSEQHIRAAIPALYAEASVKARFQAVWGELSLEERLILTAMGSLLYDAPLRTVSTSAIEAWLAQNDHLLELSLIAATIRGLEYRELITHDIRLLPGLLQTWLFENVLLENAQLALGTTSPQGTPSRWTKLQVGVAVIGVALILALIIALASTPRPVKTDSAVPTIPLTTE